MHINFSIQPIASSSRQHLTECESKGLEKSHSVSQLLEMTRYQILTTRFRSHTPLRLTAR